MYWYRSNRSFWGKFKSECYHLKRQYNYFINIKLIVDDFTQYIEFYNYDRPQNLLNGVSLHLFQFTNKVKIIRPKKKQATKSSDLSCIKNYIISYVNFMGVKSTLTRKCIAHQCDQQLTEKYISEVTCVCTTTVRRVIEQTARALRRHPTHALPEHLCFDEFKSVKSVDVAMSFMFCDTVSHRVIDIVKDRKRYALTRYL